MVVGVGIPGRANIVAPFNKKVPLLSVADAFAPGGGAPKGLNIG